MDTIVIKEEKPKAAVYIHVDKVAQSVDLGKLMYLRVFSMIGNYAYDQGIQISGTYIDLNSDVKKQQLIAKLEGEVGTEPQIDMILVYGNSYGLDELEIEVIDVLEKMGDKIGR